MEGNIRLYIDRSPDFFKLYNLFDPEAKVWVAERGGDLGGCLGVMHDQLRWGEKTLRAAYFRDFKVAPALRGGMLGVRLVREAIRYEVARGIDCVLVSIMEGNEKSLIFAEGRAGIPQAVPVGKARYYSVAPVWRRRATPGILVVPWQEGFRREAESFLPRAWSTYALAPADPLGLLTSLQSLPSMHEGDILTAWRDNRMCGILVAWDYESLMRYVVTGYTRRISLLSHALRAVARVLPISSPPRKGQPLRFRFVVLALAEGHEEDILRAMLTNMHNGMLGGRWSHYSFCLHERDPLNNALGGPFTSSIVSNLFLFCHQDTNLPWASLSGKLVYPGLTTYL